MKTIIILLSLILFLGSCLEANDIEFHGFFQGNYSISITSRNPDGRIFKWAEERFQLKINANINPIVLFFKADIYYDHYDDKANIEFREGYLDYNARIWDTRLGRQIITWGVGDLIFINDVFPKNYEAFFSGRPMEYLKKGIDGVKFGFYPSAMNFELLAVPVFEANNYPVSNRFWSFNPLASITLTEQREPPANFANTEFAIRAYRDIKGMDASLYFYKGFSRQPSMMSEQQQMQTKNILFYPKLLVYGASLQGRALNGVLSFEVGHYDSVQDREGKNPVIPNSQTKFLIGYQRQIKEDFTAGLQFYTEYMHKFSEYRKNLPSGFPPEDNFYHLITLRLTRFFMHQNLKISFFVFYSPSERDRYIISEVNYRFTDNVNATAGINIFGGTKQTTKFGGLDKNDNFYLQLRYEF